MNDAAIPTDAKHVLCRAYKRISPGCRARYWIDRTLGYQSWVTRGEKGRRDIAPLYRAGLVKEWFSPGSPPLFLTDEGERARTQFRKELGYDD